MGALAGKGAVNLRIRVKSVARCHPDPDAPLPSPFPEGWCFVASRSFAKRTDKHGNSVS